MARLDWLMARPIAHRGLHDANLSVVENTQTAVSRAVEGGFGVEIDVQATAEGEPVVFHDATLDRLTEATGPVAARTLAELRGIAFRGTSDRFWTLRECLELVDGEAPLVVEIKTGGRTGPDFARRVGELLAREGRAVAAKSFDPRAVLTLKKWAPSVPRGVIGEAFADGDPHWAHLTARRRFAARNLLHLPWTRPDFLSWRVGDLPSRAVGLIRARGRPVMAWTARTEEDRARAALYADQMVFEGFTPDTMKSEMIS